MREEAGEKAFQEAEAFEAVHPKEPAKVATQWGLVASEYADLASGAKAKVRRDDWNARAESDAQRAARETRAAEERRRREEAVKAVDEHVAAMRYPEALEALRKLEGSTKEEREALERRRRRLELLGGFKEVLSGALQGNHVPFEKVRPLTRTRESVVEADDHGVKLEGPAAARMMDWTDLRPEEVLALARQVLRSAPEPRIALATFCWEAGLKEEAAKELDTARLTDRTGTATSRIAELFEK